MAANFHHPLSWGAELADGGARFRLWAPSQQNLQLAAPGKRLGMENTRDGWFELITDAVEPGDPYRFVLDNGRAVPDPAARAQVGDVHGASRLIDPKAYAWKCPDWKGRPWHEAVLYELHVGTFSAAGDFAGVARGLDRLAELGVTAIELMPVAQFSGNRGWGYDGVLLYAPHIAYGEPTGLKQLVDAAHQRGLVVLLDVVYNHFGPDGNYLGLYAPDFFDAERITPWGAAISFMSRPVRDFFVQNALYWLDEFRFDGLRFDAIDQIVDRSGETILEEIAREARARFPCRHIHLTIEDDANTTKLLKFDESGRPCLFDAEWNDDWHHAMHVLITGETDGYYQDYADAPAKRLALAAEQGFIYQGEPSPYRQGRARGESCAHLSPTAFINFLQNHDQAGNRPFGERIATLAPTEAVEAALALLLLSPHIPMLFMGEEYGEERAFQFFTDFGEELAEAVRRGRRSEFRNIKAFAAAYAEGSLPDPNSAETFAACRLAIEEMEQTEGFAARSDFIKELIGLRRRHVVPWLAGAGGHGGRIESLAEDAFAVRFSLAKGTTLRIAANLSGRPAALSASTEGKLIFARPDAAAEHLAAGSLPAWAVVARVCLEDAA